ncbi:MAG: hypothetical protein M3203_04965 [Actinomycetota bacterium]|nr:hypothetical protein [Actinomycetota bacterium]
MERLRMVARASGEDPGMLAREAAAALAGCAGDPRALVMACRRLVDRQPASGPLWWLAARVVASPDPETEAWRSAERLRSDPTPGVVAASLPDDPTVAVLGWPEQVTDALRRRGDARVLVVDSLGDGSPLVATLERAGSDAALVPESGIGAAVAASTLVLLDASAVGSGGFLAVAGSHAAAAVAYTEQIPVWVVAGAGRVLPERLWGAMVTAVNAAGPLWDGDWDVVPLALATAVVGPYGPESPADALARVDCPDAPELTGAAFG